MREALPLARAKARFAECVRLAERGGVVVLTRHGRAVAQLCPIGGEQGHGFGNTGASGDVHETPGSYDTERGGLAPQDAEPVTPKVPADPQNRREALQRLLEESIWPRVPDEQLGARIEKSEREEILGYGSDGV